jgi:hypothetical protein
VIRAGDDNLHPLVVFDWRHTEPKARAMKAGRESLQLQLEMRSALGGETASHLGAASGSAIPGQS